MVVFLGSLGLLLGLLVMLAGAITYLRGLPAGVELRPDQNDPMGDRYYLLSQESLGLGVVLLAMNVVRHLADRPFLVPGVVLLVITLVLHFGKTWLRPDRQPRRYR